MTEVPHPVPAQLAERREVVIQSLSVHFAQDNLEAEELERRLDVAYRATSTAELDALLRDLPALPEPETPATAAPGVPTVPDAQVRDWQVVAAVMGGAERKGSWTPARTLYVVALMGGVDLDFREARFPPGVTTVHVLALMGGVDILIPPGLHVESEGIGIMGGFGGRDQPGASVDPDAPTLRINGVAFMGGIDVRQRLPGESAREAKQRLRQEKRERRRLERGE